MLTSFFALQHSIEQLSTAIKDIKTAKSRPLSGSTPPAKKTDTYRAGIKLAIAILFFMVELYLLFYLLKYAYVSSDGPGRIVRVVLIIFFTLPFALLAATADPSFASYVNQ